MKMLEGLRWKPRWVSHLGCLKGCLDFLGVDISWPWLYGGTGHAFVINIHRVVCPSGPTAWNYGPLLELCENIGCTVASVFASRTAVPELGPAQKSAWEFVRGSLDADVPCYGWELDVPEFYVIYGYDDVGYHYSGPGCEEGEGPRPWQELGSSEIGVLEVHSVHPCEPARDEDVVKDALSFALIHAENPPELVFPAYCSGPAAFDAWAEALETGCAMRFGQGYNAFVWAECRGEAVGFLNEAKERLGGKAADLFDEAIAHYTTTHDKLNELAQLHPFDEEGVGDVLSSPEGAQLVREAGAAEREGLLALRKIVDEV